MSAEEIDLSKLDLNALKNLQKQLDDELKNFEANFAQLKDAQQKFADSAAAIQALPSSSAECEMLVPLTSSLFVPGFMKGDSKLLVDIGTGYFVAKTPSDAIEAMQRKTALLKQNTDQLAKVIQSRRDNLDSVTDVMRRRMLEAEQ